MLLGNKTDKDAGRQVQKGLGERLAKVCLCVVLCASRPVSVQPVFVFLVMNERNVITV